MSRFHIHFSCVALAMALGCGKSGERGVPKAEQVTDGVPSNNPTTEKKAEVNPAGALPIRPDQTAQKAPAATEPKQPLKPGQDPQKTNPNQGNPTDVAFTINKMVMLPDRRVRVEGTTNLPKNTILVVSIYGPLLNGSPPLVDATSKCHVLDEGKFQTVELGFSTGLKDGVYMVEIKTHLSLFQPADVRQIIGSNGERLTGPLVIDEKNPIAQATHGFTILNQIITIGERKVGAKKK